MQRRALTLTSMLGLVLMFLPSAAWAQYQLRTLVSNQVKQAEHVDPLSVNGWGLARGATTPWYGSSRYTPLRFASASRRRPNRPTLCSMSSGGIRSRRSWSTRPRGVTRKEGSC